MSALVKAALGLAAVKVKRFSLIGTAKPGCMKFLLRKARLNNAYPICSERKQRFSTRINAF